MGVSASYFLRHLTTIAYHRYNLTHLTPSFLLFGETDRTPAGCFTLYAHSREVVDVFFNPSPACYYGRR